MADALRAGVAQVAILGAGFDARAYRVPGMTGATGFEVDHPSTSDEDVGASDHRARCDGVAARDVTGYEFHRIALTHVQTEGAGA